MEKHFRARASHGTRRSAPRKKNMPTYDPALFVKEAVQITESTVFTPTHHFVDFPFDPALQNNIAKHGYSTPTPIQDGAIPHVLAGRDVIGIANTGTGKTAAFLLPLIHKIIKKSQERVLIVVPTRELALQIDKEFQYFTENLSIRSAVCIGGTDIRRQLRALHNRPAIIIGTPGRLMDLMDRKALAIDTIATVVLDEVDRMLDMGFVEDIRTIVSRLAPQRQSLFFSATMPRPIAALAQQFLTDPITITIAARPTAENVEQNVIMVENAAQKIETLHDLLLKPDFQKVLVFCRTKRDADHLAHELNDRGFRADAIHGDKTQGRRERALRRFRDDDVKILTATDVAARGLDIPDVTHVINFSVPENYEDYIHRIGRTGRGGKMGNALTFFLPDDHAQKKERRPARRTRRRR